MKTKIILFVALFSINMNTFTQTIKLSFSALYNNSIVQLDSIIIQNVTQGGDTTLYFPDSILELGNRKWVNQVDLNSGINLGNSNVENLPYFEVSPNYPNPFSGNTSINILLHQGDYLSLRLFDIMGRELAFYNNFHEAGQHKFNITAGLDKMLILVVEYSNQRKVVKMIQHNSSGQKNEINYDGFSNIDFQPRTSKSNFVWQHANDLRFFGYVTVNANQRGAGFVEATPSISQSYMFDICDNLCFDTPFIEDFQNNVYRTVQIGSQCWMADNLKVLPYVNSPSEGSSMSPMYYVYNYFGSSVQDAINSSAYTEFGVLYNWDAAKNACPIGWHLPTDSEWMTLEQALGMTPSEVYLTGLRGTNQGSKMAAKSELWNNGLLVENVDFDDSGFDGLPAGGRSGFGEFGHLYYNAMWWSASSVSTDAYIRYINYNSSKIFRGLNSKELGRSVRCIKD